MIGIAVFGAGRIGRIHASNLHQHADARVLHIVDVVEEAAVELAATCSAQGRLAGRCTEGGLTGGIAIARIANVSVGKTLLPSAVLSFGTRACSGHNHFTNNLVSSLVLINYDDSYGVWALGNILRRVEVDVSARKPAL